MNVSLTNELEGFVTQLVDEELSTIIWMFD
jgi:hypothetical protein